MALMPVKTMLVTSTISFGVFFYLGMYYFQEPSGGESSREAKKKYSLPQNLGSVSLQSESGHRVDEEYFRGYWTILAFGHSSCDEQCQERLERLKGLLETIKGVSAQVRFAFVSLSTTLTAAESLRTLIDQFHPEIQGFVGRQRDLGILRRSLGYHQGPQGTMDEGQVFDLHRIFIIGPDVRLQAILDASVEKDRLALEIKNIEGIKAL